MIKTLLICLLVLSCVVTSGCFFGNSEPQTRTDHFWYGGASFVSNDKVCYDLNRTSSWGPASSHTETELAASLHTRKLDQIEPETSLNVVVDNYGAETCYVLSNGKFITAGSNVVNNTKTYEIRFLQDDGSILVTHELPARPRGISVTQDEAMLAVSTRGSFRIFDVNGNLLKSDDSLGHFVWESNTTAFAYDENARKLVSYSYTNGVLKNFDLDFKPMKYNAALHQLYCLDFQIFKTLDTDTMQVTEEDLSEYLPPFYNPEYELPNISPNGRYILVGDGGTYYLVDRESKTYTVFIENHTDTYDI